MSTHYDDYILRLEDVLDEAVLIKVHNVLKYAGPHQFNSDLWYHLVYKAGFPIGTSPLTYELNAVM